MRIVLVLVVVIGGLRLFGEGHAFWRVLDCADRDDLAHDEIGVFVVFKQR